MLIGEKDLEPFGDSPQVAERVNELWGTAELQDYVKGVLAEGRKTGGMRLPRAAESALSRLVLVHERELRKRDEPRPLFESIKRLRGNAHFLVVYGFAPRIGRKLVEFWSLPVCDTYLHELLWDTRDGTRRGFPAKVGTALMQLATIHTARYGKATRKPRMLARAG